MLNEKKKLQHPEEAVKMFFWTDSIERGKWSKFGEKIF